VAQADDRQVGRIVRWRWLLSISQISVSSSSNIAGSTPFSCSAAAIVRGRFFLRSYCA